MLAYHSDQAVKDKYVQRMKDHIASDELIRGTGYEDGRGCAVGCTLNNYNHSQYPIELGIPEWLARVEDTLFEGMSLEKSKTFPLLFLESINPGIDLEKVKSPFLIFILKSVLEKFDHKKFPYVLNAVNQVLGLYESGETDLDKFREAADAAWAAARAADDDARAAFAAADASDDTWAAAWSASWAAADDAARAADAAANAANSSAWSASLAADKAADDAEYDKFGDYLLQLLKECN